MKKVSIVISAWNESRIIGQCLESVKWADEIIVVDNSSTDNTAQIAKKAGATVYSQPNKLMLNLNKNYGFSKASNEWILNLDADEEVTPLLKLEILDTINKDDVYEGYWIPRKNIIFGKWIEHGLWWPDKQLRLFKKNKGKFPCFRIHEYIKIDGPTSELAEPYIHSNYVSVSQYIQKLDRCTTSEASEMLNSGYQFVWHDLIRFPVSDFLKIYFAQLAWKDGIHGLVLSLLQTFYSFVEIVKIWENKSFTQKDIILPVVNQELKNVGHDYNYWFLTTAINQNTNIFRKFILKLFRKINLG
jgi:(heptosyl)LPS beta-1,4-glucosyltransferase